MAKDEETIWRKFIDKHLQMFILFIVAAVMAIIGVIYVFLWFVGDAQATGLVPTILGEWAMAHVISFLLNLLFWELVIVGIPVGIVIALIYVLWWKQLPAAERKEYRTKHLFGKSSRTRDSGGVFSFFVFIAFLIKIYLDGNWDKAFATWEFDYLISSWITALIWMFVIIGIPMLLGLIWWITSGRKK
jgi:hypothetical protein